MDFVKSLAFLLLSFKCVITHDQYVNMENRMLEIQRRLTVLKQDIKAINSMAQKTEIDLEENIKSLPQMFSGFTKTFDENFDDIKEKFRKHYLKQERRKLSKLLEDTDESEIQEKEELTDTELDDIDEKVTKSTRYEDFGVVFKASKLTKTNFGKDLKTRQKETIVFSDIEYNIGDGYNSTTGIFTTPRKGTYLFTVQFYINYGCRIEAGIFSNGENSIAVSSLSPGNSACYNFEGIVNLEKGDLVEVTHLFSEYNYMYPNGHDILDNTFNSNFFSGAMIR